jgi:hypothetical protein
MKLVKALLVTIAFAGPSAFATQSNSTCPHSKKNDSWTKTASLDAVNTVFGANSAPKKTAPQTTPNTTR